jgi:biotin-(acetyl-CoA carboxylase) ligase
VNDIFVGVRKLGGILTEAVVEDGRMLALVVGVGLNLRRFELPPEYGTATDATSLEAELPPDRFAMLRVDALVGALVARLRGAIDAVADCRADDLRAAYCRYVGAGVVSASAAPS